MAMWCCLGMDPFAEDFDIFFSRMSGSSSGTLGTSAKGDRPPILPGGKGKLPISSFGGSRGTPATHKRKCMKGMAAEADRLDLNECYSRALKACHEAAFYLSHSFCDFSDVSTAQAEVERLRGELRLGRSREEKLTGEVSALQRRLDDQTQENTRISKKLDEVESDHGELLSRQQEMMDRAFTLIMTEVWSVDLELVVPRVEKWVDKSAILKAIEVKRVFQAPPSHSPQRSFGADLSSTGAVQEGSSSLAADVPVDATVEGNGGEDVPLSA